jgi:drug/metabolite transporter (DMT)-like permease
LKKYLLILIPIFLIVLAQTAGKYGVSEYEQNNINIFILISYSLMFIRSFIWMILLKKFDLKSIYPLLSLSYVAVLFVAYFLFDETLSFNKLLGTATILIGITIHLYGEHCRV